MSNDKPKKRLRFIFEVFCKAIALTLPEQAIATLVTTQGKSLGKL
ncbi:hypothetical protein [Nostoc sp.]